MWWVMVMDQNVNTDAPLARSTEVPALLFEMMRSFTVLAKTLNLSVAVEELGSTRQTVRRHIGQLEDAMGCKLFAVEQRRYTLTDQGARAVGPAQWLLTKGGVWHQGNFQSIDGMSRISYEGPAGAAFYQQQIPMSGVWSGKSDLLRAALKAWTLSEGKLESLYNKDIRPYILAFRAAKDDLICMEVGEKSLYSNWFGWANARSSVGRNLSEFAFTQEFSSIADSSFRDVEAGQGVRLDQTAMWIRKNADDPLECLLYDRLLMGVQMPDGTPAIISVCDRPSEMKIDALDANLINEIPDKLWVDFRLTR